MSIADSQLHGKRDAYVYFHSRAIDELTIESSNCSGSLLFGLHVHKTEPGEADE
jgi:hypothetical protein